MAAIPGKPAKLAAKTANRIAPRPRRLSLHHPGAEVETGITGAGLMAEISEQNHWQYLYPSAAARVTILSGEEPQRRSRPIKGLVRSLLPGGLLIEVSSTRVDNLHIVGELSEWRWVRNSLEVEIPLPQEPLKMAVISGTSEWLNKSPGGQGFLVGISINKISETHKGILARLFETKSLA